MVAKVKPITKPSLFRGGRALYLAVGKAGWKSCVRRIIIGGGRHEFVLSGYSYTDLPSTRRRPLDNSTKNIYVF